MEPEEYQRAVGDAFAGAARLATLIGWVAAGAGVFALAVAAVWRFRHELVRPDGATFLRPARPRPKPTRAVPPPQPAWPAWLSVRRAGVRRPLAATLSVLSFVAGMTAGVLQLDDGWSRRHRRFWYRTPEDLDRALLWWAAEPPPRPAPLWEVATWADRRGPTAAAVAAGLLRDIKAEQPAGFD